MSHSMILEEKHRQQCSMELYESLRHLRAQFSKTFKRIKNQAFSFAYYINLYKKKEIKNIYFQKYYRYNIFYKTVTTNQCISPL